MIMIQFNFNFICTALNHHYSLKGLNRQNINDTTLTQAPKKSKKELPSSVRKKPWDDDDDDDVSGL